MLTSWSQTVEVSVLFAWLLNFVVLEIWYNTLFALFLIPGCCIKKDVIAWRPFTVIVWVSGASFLVESKLYVLDECNNLIGHNAAGSLMLHWVPHHLQTVQWKWRIF
jgi:hypothetical protein